MLLLAFGVLGIAFLVRAKRHLMPLQRRSVLSSRPSATDYRALDEGRMLAANLKSTEMAHRLIPHSS